MKLVKNQWFIRNEMDYYVFTIKENQKSYSCFQNTINKNIDDKVFNYNLDLNSFRNFISNFYESILKEKFRNIADKEISFERVFMDNTLIHMDTNDEIYLMLLLFDEINKTPYKNIIEDKYIKIHFNLKNNKFAIYQANQRVLFESLIEQYILNHKIINFGVGI